MTIKSNVHLHNWQKDLVKGILSYPHDIHVCKAQRQRGKSIACETVVLYFCLNNRHSTTIYVTPSFSQCEKVYNELLNAVKNTSVFRKTNGGSHIIEFTNGSTVQFLSGSQSIENLQGFTVRGGILILDECAFLSDEVIMACLPFVDANKAPILMVSTPQFRQGLFYESFIDSNNHNYDWCTYDTSCMLSQQRLEQYRKNLPSIKFRQYYLGEFVDANSGVFGDYSAVVKQPPLIEPKHTIVFGIDWGTGTGGDDTAVSVWIKETKEMVALIYFNDLNATQQIDEIVKLANKYNCSSMLVETNSIGEVYKALLRQKLIEAHLKTVVQGFTTTNDSKEKLVDAMCVAIQNGKLSLIKDERLFNQMNHFVAKPLASGKVQYCNDKDKFHDDCVMATMLGYKACCGANYNVK